MFPDPASIFATPEYHCLGLGNDRAQFVRMDRQHYHDSIFLDRRLSAPDPKVHEIPIATLLVGAEDIESPRVRWIFHVAHCGSTLLARLLDQPGASLVLREPPALRQVGMERSERAPRRDLENRFRLAHRLSARQFDPAEAVLIKANVPVNFILDFVAAEQPLAPAIMLYLTWQDYLLAILRTDNHRAWVVRISGAFRHLIERQCGHPMGESVSERAAALWLAQMRIFSDQIDRNPNAFALNAEDFFADPLSAATLAARHLDLESVDPSANAALLGSYSKEPSRRFDSKERGQRAAADRARLAGELKAAGDWLDRALSGVPDPTGFKRSIG